MTTRMNLDKYSKNAITTTTSKGSLKKWNVDNRWYKLNGRGYEALAEFVASKLLDRSNVKAYCKYWIEEVTYKEDTYICSVSEDFRSSPEQSVMSVYRLAECNDGLGNVFKKNLSVSDKISAIVDEVESITGLTGFGKYLTQLLEFDAFILNEDRHFNNIALLLDEEDSYQLCPIFDSGLSLGSDIVDYTPDMSLSVIIRKIKSKPFSSSFSKQVEAARDLYGPQLKFYFDESYIDEICDEASKFFGPFAVGRVRGILKIQMKKYPELFQNDGLDETSVFR